MENTTKLDLPITLTNTFESSIQDCRSCIFGSSMIVNGDILCRIKGAVSKNHTCRKYRPSPFHLNSTSFDVQKNCAGCRFFTTDPEDNDPVKKLMNRHTPEIGLCSLFSVRKYNGITRKACSKFVSKDTFEVS